MVFFEIPELKEMEPEDKEKKLAEELNHNMEKFQQIKQLNPNDIGAGGKYHKAYLKFMNDFQTSVYNYVSYYATEALIFNSADQMYSLFLGEHNTFRKMFRLAEENNLMEINKEIGQIRGRFVNVLLAEENIKELAFV